MSIKYKEVQQRCVDVGAGPCSGSGQTLQILEKRVTKAEHANSTRQVNSTRHQYDHNKRVSSVSSRNVENRTMNNARDARRVSQDVTTDNRRNEQSSNITQNIVDDTRDTIGGYFGGLQAPSSGDNLEVYSGPIATHNISSQYNRYSPDVYDDSDDEEDDYTNHVPPQKQSQRETRDTYDISKSNSKR